MKLIWTKEKCKEEALKYDTRNSFYVNSGSAYSTSAKNKWLDDICSHMIKLKHHEDYWTKDKCTELALTCENRKEFHLKYNAAHKFSIKNGWIDEICSHMTQSNNNFRCIYSYEFSDNHVYIGLTYNIKNRNSRHFKEYNNSIVYKYSKETKLEPTLIQLTDYLDIKSAKIMEEKQLNNYKQNGWIILNTAKTGSLGGITLIWTKEKCQEAASQCKNKSDFYKKYQSASGSALKNGWIDEICSHMENKTKPKGYWNYENCLNEAIKVNNKKLLNHSSAYKSIVKNNWKDKIYDIMNWNKQ